MGDSFICDVVINQIRHLSKIYIHLSYKEKKHLIITGKNGSGKTSLLLAIRNIVAGEILGWFNSLQETKNIRNNFYGGLSNISYSMKNISENIRNNGVNDYTIDQQRLNIESLQRVKRDYETIVDFFDKIISDNPSIVVNINNRHNIPHLYSNRQFIVHFFDAKRTSYVGSPTGVYGDTLETSNSILNSINPNFLQYIVNLRAEQSFAKDEGDLETANNIEGWFANFTKQLAILFGDDSLKLIFDRKRFNFLINVHGRTPFDFNSMSDGYSAILSIVTEIMMRMPKGSNNYEVEGIVLVDEIETHLHIELQKKILPFLTSFFPNIQFIISSHSPFVLNSISNSIVYDLEKNIRVEDLSGYSMEGIVEGYFQEDKYSEEVKNRVTEYEQLALNENRNLEEENRYEFLKRYFKELPKFYSEELELKLNQIQLAAL